MTAENSTRIPSPRKITQARHTNNVINLMLVKNNISQDTIDALEYLLYEARRGECIGFAYAALMKYRTCVVDTTGEANRNPLLAAGVVSMLSNDIARRSRDED